MHRSTNAGHVKMAMSKEKKMERIVIYGKKQKGNVFSSYKYLKFIFVRVYFGVRMHYTFKKYFKEIT